MIPRPLAVAATALLLAGAAGSTPTRADFLKTAAAKSRPAAATRTVTLDLTGLDWGGCADAVRSALVRAKGVKKAEVSFSKKQAVVTYDPKATSVPALIKAVDNTPSMMGPTAPKYSAKVHRVS